MLRIIHICHECGIQFKTSMHGTQDMNVMEERIILSLCERHEDDKESIKRLREAPKFMANIWKE